MDDPRYRHSPPSTRLDESSRNAPAVQLVKQVEEMRAEVKKGAQEAARLGQGDGAPEGGQRGFAIAFSARDCCS